MGAKVVALDFAYAHNISNCPIAPKQPTLIKRIHPLILGDSQDSVPDIGSKLISINIDVKITPAAHANSKLVAVDSLGANTLVAILYKE